MAKLTSAARKKLPTKVFGLPEKRAYPINDASHARNALSRAAANATPAQQKTIKAKVHAMFPSIGMDPSKTCGLSSMCA
jgi:hypothetical protein